MKNQINRNSKQQQVATATSTPTSLQQWKKSLYAFGVGTAAGFTIGIVGWGGAQILIPAMTVPLPLANYSQLAATGISLSSLSFSSVSASYKFLCEDKVVVPIAMSIGLPAVISARFGTVYLAQRLSSNALALFFNAFSVILIPTHFWIQQRADTRRTKQQQQQQKQQQTKPHIENAEGRNSTTVNKTINNNTLSTIDDDDTMTTWFSQQKVPADVYQHISFGLFLGTISSLMGVGGLPFAMSYVTEFCHDSMPPNHQYVQGTAVCAVVPSVLMSALSRLRSVPLLTAGCVATGATLGSSLGAGIALQLDPVTLHHLFMGSLLLFGGRSTIGAIRNLQRIYKNKTIMKK